MPKTKWKVDIILYISTDSKANVDDVMKIAKKKVQKMIDPYNEMYIDCIENC